MPRSCVFCGATPVTREHVWPDWWRRFAGEIDVPFPHDVEYSASGVETRHEESDRREWEQPPFEMTVRAFCADCNNGWMSDLEDKASRLITATLPDISRSFHRRQMRELATWTLLRAIVLDQTHPTRQVVFPEYRRHLFEKRVPPAKNLWIWLTLCDAELPSLYSYQGLLITDRTASEPPAEPTVFVATFTLGPLVFQLAGTTSLPADHFDQVVYPQLDVTRIWPSQSSVEFRPRTVMTRRALDSFATAIHDDLQRLMPEAERVEPVRGPS